MNTRLRPVGALATCALLVSMVFTSADATRSPATTIKRKGGQVTRGEIKGLIVQGQTGDVSEGSLSGHGALYFVVEGKDIEAVDEDKPAGGRSGRDEEKRVVAPRSDSRDRPAREPSQPVRLDPLGLRIHAGHPGAGSEGKQTSAGQPI